MELYPTCRMLDRRRESVDLQQVTMPPAHTPSQTRGPRSGAQTATIAAIMRGLLTDTAYVGMRLAGSLHCLAGLHGSIIQYRMLHLFVDSFKSDNK